MATKSSPARSFATSVDIPTDSRAKTIKVLNQHLAESFDLMSQVKQAHWNVKGPDFWQLHRLFDEVAARAAEWADEFAERDPLKRLTKSRLSTVALWSHTASGTRSTSRVSA